jgi:PPM family protein phosphatase
MDCEIGQACRLGDRSSNQDRIGVACAEGAVLLALADGMGGHAGGEIAAQVAVASLCSRFRKSATPVPDPSVFLKAAIEEAHHQVVAAGQAHRPPITPRTTLVACLVQGDQACWAHVGDSRFYLLRLGQVVERTRDHTYVERLYEVGLISDEERLTHPLRNVVTGSVGGEGQPAVTVNPAVRLTPGDVLLLCSDGLWGALPEPEIAAAVERRPLARAVEGLAQRAEQASHPHSDNISVLALRWHAAAPAEQRPETAGEPLADCSGEPGGDELSEAIDAIRRAIHDYGEEMER